MPLYKLTKYPSNLRRGGSLFTMVIFIMLLISTALMYYYFQRTQFLERQITALQNGEQPEPSGLSNFVSWIKGTQRSDTEDLNAAAEPPKSTPRPQPVPAETPEIVQDTLSEPTESSQEATTATEPSLLPLTEDANESELTDESSNQRNPVNGNDTLPEDTVEEEDAAPAPSQPINSMYDTQQPPPVRVRSPQRR